MIGDYEEDAHFCLRCHLTIIGLDAYVAHRKSGCNKNDPKSPLLPPDESFSLKADDFFSSLELQSSSKKQQTTAPVSAATASATPSTSGKNFSGILTRSKTSAVIQATQQVGKNAWIGAHEFKELDGGGDNAAKLIKAVDNLSRNAHAGLRRTASPEYYHDSDEQSDQDYEEQSDSDEDDVLSEEDERDVPPRTHTGGKWKPSSPIEWRSAAPSPSYTGGKWKPGSPTHQSPNESNPPPTHTKGKWIPENAVHSTRRSTRNILNNAPPFRKSNGSVQYWCGPCNRHLASKIVYARHLKSLLHFKRTLNEADEFDDSTAHLNHHRDKDVGGKQSRTIVPSRKPVDYWPSTTSTAATQQQQQQQQHTAAEEDNKDTTTGQQQQSKRARRMRRKIYVKCGVCRSRVTTQTMGKHLISHYHCRKGDITLPEARQMVLDHIHDIVLQSPYQCAACRFYCNTHDDFLGHWTSAAHLDEIASYSLITCTFCNLSTADNASMHAHLISAEHSEVIAVINRSMPIVIRAINPLRCIDCSKSFRLNIQLKLHCEAEGHTYTGTTVHEYRRPQTCQVCEKVFKSMNALQVHLAAKHNSKIYFCSQCSLMFSTLEESNAHKKSVLHRYAAKQQQKSSPRTCDYCRERFDGILELKAHLTQVHPERTHDCPHCGKQFIIPQEVSAHLRAKACRVDEDRGDNSCDRCEFSTDRLAELLFHKSLHDEPDAKARYKCPLCEKHFVKASLRYHIQNHTNEKTFACRYCGAKFARKNNWVAHVRKHEDNAHFLSKSEKRSAAERRYLCATCGASFNKASVLQNHMTTHGAKKFRCPEPNCFYMGRSAGELKVHMVTHSDVKNFHCTMCDYRGKTKPQLNRHMAIHAADKRYKCTQCTFSTRLSYHLRRHQRLHNGSKPFSCPHCPFKCNNLENLRRHVLSSNKHPGKHMYECKFCEEDQFHTNFAKEFKAHLIADHSDMFGTNTEAVGYISGIYDALEEDNRPVPTLASEPEGYEPSKSDHQHHQDELFPMYIIGKPSTDGDEDDALSMVGSFDVGESGELVTSFNEEGETYFDPKFM